MNKYASLTWMLQKIVNVVKYMDAKDPNPVNMIDKFLEKIVSSLFEATCLNI